MRKIDRLEKDQEDMNRMLHAIQAVLLKQGLAQWDCPTSMGGVTVVKATGSGLPQRFEALCKHLGLEAAYRRPHMTGEACEIVSLAKEALADQTPELTAQQGVYHALKMLRLAYAQSGNEIDKDVRMAVRNLLAHYEEWLDEFLEP